MYRVIKRFRDLQDNEYTYEVGDKFPRSGVDVSDERIMELLGTGNTMGVPLISGKPRKATEKAGDKKKGESPSDTPKAKGRAKKRSKNGNNAGTGS